MVEHFGAEFNNLGILTLEGLKFGDLRIRSNLGTLNAHLSVHERCSWYELYLGVEGRLYGVFSVTAHVQSFSLENLLWKQQNSCAYISITAKWGGIIILSPPSPSPSPRTRRFWNSKIWHSFDGIVDYSQLIFVSMKGVHEHTLARCRGNIIRQTRSVRCTSSPDTSYLISTIFDHDQLLWPICNND